jgi:RNA polymerase sigma factor (sigma-70 family)
MTDARIAHPASFGHRPLIAFVTDLMTAGAELLWSLRGRPYDTVDFDRSRSSLLIVLDSTAEAEMEADLAQSGAETSQGADVMQRFHRTIVPHMDAAYNFARFLSRDQDAAQDILQDAFLRACRSFGGYRGGDPRAWIFSIVRNCYHAWLIERRRKARYEVPIARDTDDDDQRAADYDIASDEDTPEMTMIHATESLRVRKVISSLPEAMREVLVLRELEDMSYRQIAEIVDVPIGTVMSRLARARSEFAEAWRLLEGGGSTK